MSLEAFFNLILEIIFRYQGFSDTPKKLISFPKEIKKLEKKNSGIKAKYKKTLSFFTKELIEEDKSPYKDFSCLIDIRNKLIHPHPEEIELISGTLVNENHKILSYLLSQGIIKKHESQKGWIPASFWGGLTKSNVAKWACDTACTMRKAVFNTIPECSCKNNIEKYV
jgi:hypothetical protein